ncbi:MAG: fibronectin type III domain-containing protein [Chthoniobacteraceae bacterium]
MSSSLSRFFVSCGLTVLLWLAGDEMVLALAPKDYAVQLSATVSSSPARITLSWVADSAALQYKIFRKKQDDSQWQKLAVVAGSAASYADSTVQVGTLYEYRVNKVAADHVGYGYLVSAIDYPLVEDRGTVLLVVESTVGSALTTDLTQLQQDLVGDGWTVVRHDVATTDSVKSVKNWIVNQYNASPTTTKALFLFGHVPVPYSGNFNPDGHANHVGAWPADTYYADMDGVWTDTTVRNTSAARKANRNVPGDGKFDQSKIPGKVELQEGRVDLSSMSLFFPQTETDLLQQYLQRDHAFRTGQLVVNQRALIDDNFAGIKNQPFSARAWSDFSVLVGAGQTTTGDWQASASAGSYLWAYGCGAGNYGYCNGVGDSKTFTTTTSQVVFTELLGSYFGDWDNDGNFLRVMLANNGYGLTCVWSGRPQWTFDYMAMGFPIGYCTKLSENNNGEYVALTYQRGVHMALMGDPTLRMASVQPVSNVTGSETSGGGVTLNWSASSDSVLGYAVYRSTSLSGPFVRVNADLLTGTNCYDASGTTEDIYMIRAVARVVSPEGTYFNASQGVFVTKIVTQP